MPIFPNNRDISVFHPILGRGEEPTRLGDMSHELAQWLKWKLDEHNAISEDQSEIHNFARFFRQSDIQAFNTRSHISAARGYNPVLALDSGQLTQPGIERARLASAVIALGIGQNVNSILKPSELEYTEDVFITGNITIRQAALLEAAHNAIIEAEELDRRELDKEFKTFLQGYKGDNPHIPSEDHEEPELELTELFKIRSFTNTTQPVQAITYNVGPSREGYVPTAIFGQKARNDLKNLVKYGLVDLRAQAQGVRGRPKHVFRVSPTGLVVVKDLSRQNII
jgi:hypothetical protein